MLVPQPGPEVDELVPFHVLDQGALGALAR